MSASSWLCQVSEFWGQTRSLVSYTNEACNGSVQRLLPQPTGQLESTVAKREFKKAPKSYRPQKSRGTNNPLRAAVSCSHHSARICHPLGPKAAKGWVRRGAPKSHPNTSAWRCRSKPDPTYLAKVMSPTLFSGLLRVFEWHTMLTASCWACRRVGKKSPFLMYSLLSTLKHRAQGKREA